MRILLLTRGLQGSGKSTWIQKNNLGPYTLSADKIRLLLQSPETSLDGKMVISQKNDTKVWKMLFDILEQRMQRGELIVVDATHYKSPLLSRYKKLIDTYKYRPYIIDFTDVSLDTCLERNRTRESYKFVPEDVIKKVHAVFEAEKNSAECKEISNRFTVLPHESAMDILKQNLLFDFTNKYNKVVVFGDIHGCYKPIKNYFNINPIRDDYQYIFTGDYIDRGIQNKEVLEFLIENMNKSNFLYLEGNHECLDKNTDILTDKGWINIKYLVENKINIRPYTYNLNTKKIQLDKIIDYHKKYQSEMIKIETNNTKQIVSFNHDILIDNRKIKAIDFLNLNIKDFHKRILPTSFMLNEDYNIDNNWLKLITWVVCDGCLVNSNKNKPNLPPKRRIQFKLSKQRKIKELIRLLNAIGIKYTIKKSKKNTENSLQPYIIRIYGDDCRKIWSYFPEGKLFPDFFKHLSLKQAEIVLDTISITDGSRNGQRIYYYTKSQHDIDIINELCIKNGYSFTYKKSLNSGYKNGNNNYICIITKNYQWVKFKNNIDKIKYDDYSYCITTSNGTLITRIDGKCAITGNCHLKKYCSKDYIPFSPSVEDKKILDKYLDKNYIKERYDQNIRSSEFLTNTVPQIEGISKSNLRQLCRKLGQMAYFKFGNKKYFITHGGCPCEPSIFTSSQEFIKGVGKYEELDDIYNSWNKNNSDCVLIHAHRNLFDLPTKVNDNIYNLCDKPEFGKFVRIIEINPDGKIDVVSVPNDVYNKDINSTVVANKIELKNENSFLQQLNESKLIQKKILDDGIVSYNFTREAFKKRKWNDLTIKARGLFVDSSSENVVARGYDKFWNIDENDYTKLPALHQKLQFPVYAYRKENGFLGLVSYNPKADDLFIASKSTNQGDFADMVRAELDKLGDTCKEQIKNFCKANNCTLIFECINQDLDPHIIAYDDNGLVLLDIVKNDFDTHYYPYSEVKNLAIYLNIPCKELEYTFNNWDEFYNFIKTQDKYYGYSHEGWVFVDSNNYMVKYKTNYYRFWKYMRGIKQQLEKCQDVKKTFINEIEVLVFNFMRKIPVDELKQKSIIDIQELFYNSIDK